MSEHDALLRAILENPEDDTVRLVYADWLDENDQPERAEFIRVQIELAKVLTPLSGFKGCIECKSGCVEDFCRYHALRQRDYHLWQSHFPTQADWDLPFGPLKWAWLVTPRGETVVNAPVAVLRRGFVDEIRIPVDAFCGQLCTHCDGRGEVRFTDAAGDADDLPCEECGGNLKGGYNRGTGRVGGLAKVLFEAHPIRSVQLSDRRPTGAGSWLREGGPWPSPTLASHLVPPRLYAYVREQAGVSTRGTLNYAHFESAKHALTAVSVSCVRYGRDLAGLTNKENR